MILILVSEHHSCPGLGAGATLTQEPWSLVLGVRSGAPSVPTVCWVLFLFSFSTLFFPLRTVKSLQGIRIVCPLLGCPSEGMSFFQYF